MDNVLWNTFFPFVISIVAGIATTYIIDISRRKIVYYSIVTKQPKNHQKEHTISTLFIWCDKYHVITEDDIDTAFPPCIEIDGNHEIYGVEIIREPNSPDFNRATVETHTKKCNLSFKQFDFNNVIMLNVFHSGKSVKFIGNINAYDTESVKITKLNSVVIWGVVFFFHWLDTFCPHELCYESFTRVRLGTLFSVCILHRDCYFIRYLDGVKLEICFNPQNYHKSP